MVCIVCNKIFDSSPKRPHKFLEGFYVHYGSAHEIELSDSGDNCYICSTIWDQFTEEEKQLVRSSAEQLSSASLFQKLIRSIWLNLAIFLFWIFGSLFTYSLKSQLLPNDYCCYGWRIRRGIVQFSFGTMDWKTVVFALIPSNGKSVCGIYADRELKMNLDALPEMREQFKFVSPELNLMDERFRKEPVEEDMNSEKVWSLVEDWITECAKGNLEHIRCHQYVHLATSTVASRLIDVRAGKLGDKIRLTVSSNQREPLPYMTLSYHWGPNVDQSKLQLLRQDTLLAYQHEIPMSHFSNLFQDAIEVARKLNIRYLWIDAYCIIQQDPLDWQIEAARMGDIYQHAILNIAAGGARDTTERLMKQRNSIHVEPCKLVIDWKNMATRLGQAANESFDIWGPHYIIDALYIDDQILETPLNRRAWVFQEQQLSPRILHFGKHQMFWRCWAYPNSPGQACETFPKGLPTFNSAGAGFRRAHQLVLLTLLDSDIQRITRLDLYLFWNTVIQEYTRCEITKQTDKLIAITGLAQKFAQVLELGDRFYAAGLWREFIAMTLCWQGDISTITSRDPSYRPSKRIAPNESLDYVAPSWSWASVNGPIQLLHQYRFRFLMNEGFEKIELCTILEVVMEPITLDNSFGQIKNGQISLSGYIVPENAFYWIRNFRRYRNRGQIQNIVNCLTFPYPTLLFCNFDDIKDFEDRKYQWLGLFFLTRGIELLPLLFWEHKESPKRSFVEGLMVVRDAQENTFRRVGYFYSIDDSWRLPTTSGYLHDLMEKNENIILL